MGYPIQLKEAVLKKVLQRSKPQHEIAGEFGITGSLRTQSNHWYHRD